jgi:hypothetical protein
MLFHFEMVGEVNMDKLAAYNSTHKVPPADPRKWDAHDLTIAIRIGLLEPFRSVVLNVRETDQVFGPGEKPDEDRGTTRPPEVAT